MLNKNIYDEFTLFLKKYHIYFRSNDEAWTYKLEKVKTYINKNNIRPNKRDENKEIKLLGQWLIEQLINYKKKISIMKNKNIYNKFTDFLQQYEKYFKTNDEIWHEKLNH